MNRIDMSKYHDPFTLKSRVKRVIWSITYFLFFRFFFLNIFRTWRNFILRLFGAKIGNNSLVYASVKIWAPWNLEIGSFSAIGRNVDIYNQGLISIGSNTIISQKSYICASSHYHTTPSLEWYAAPVYIKDQVWICADAFIGPGVIIEDGAVVGARSAVFKKVDSWTVVGGNPAKFIKTREIKS
ncbi:putative colanic acid biosynthesis acetyltransferase [uncultured Maribacter sp.]|uniref:putative colanic acid biosynthesis acetyltransferase n=1 Tax=uncultured Maribacter sp. TaxID=431308 RepID=UPI00262856D2|nr:putative colanic acid biosynthesis acetyltransferase [uncultured Maribacter sp.]